MSRRSRAAARVSDPFDFASADPDAVAAAVLKHVRNQAARWWARRRP